MAKVAKRQFLVQIQPTAGGVAFKTYFAQKSGGATTSSNTKVWDGGNPVPTVLSAVAQTSDLSLTKPYDPANDESWIKSAKKVVGQASYQISVTPTDVNLNPISGMQETYQGILSAVTPADVDASSSDSATWSVTFAIASVA